MSFNMFLTGTQEQVIAANAQIESNIGIPYPGTDIWDVPTQNYSDAAKWFIGMPQPNAIYNGHSGEEIMLDVVNVEQEESDSSWFPPPSPFPY